MAGSSVQVLEERWETTLAGRSVQTLRLKLTGVTYVDAVGEACLAALHRQGAVLIGADPLTKSIVAEITKEAQIGTQKSEVKPCPEDMGKN